MSFSTLLQSSSASAAVGASAITRITGSVLLARTCTQDFSLPSQSPSRSSLFQPANSAFTYIPMKKTGY